MFDDMMVTSSKSERFAFNAMYFITFVGLLGMSQYAFFEYLATHHHTNLLPWCWIYWCAVLGVFKTMKYLAKRNK